MVNYNDEKKTEQQPANIEDLLEYGVTCLEKNKYEEAKQIFQNVLKADQSFKSFEEINNLIKKLASEKRPLDLPESLRKAMLCLGIVYSMQNNFRLAEDYILNAAYSCKDAEILLLAGYFYLSIPDAELDTAFAYFQKASEKGPSIIGKCDDLVQNFVKSRAVFYPYSLLKPYLDIWNSFKDKIIKHSKNKSEDNKTGFEFADRLLKIWNLKG